MRIKLKYVEDFANTTETLVESQWRLTSVFDPNLSGAGQQPMYRDQIAALYTKYRVNACKYKITINQNHPNSTTHDAVDALVRIRSLPDVYGTMRDAVEGSRFSKRTLQVNARPLVYKGYVKTKSFIRDNNPESRASLMTTNPLDNVVLTLLMQSAKSIPNLVDISVRMEFVFYVDFYERIQVTGS